MAQSMDAHSSFVYLVDNLPKWRTTFDSLATHTAEKHAEFVAEYARLVKQARPKRKKTPSISSLHTTDEQDSIDNSASGEENVDNSSSNAPIEINPLEAGTRYLYAQTRRKRKPGTSIRSGASGPQKFRNRSHVVVYYDSYLQKQLDAMVKEVGLGRNNLRKGKNALAAATGFQLPTLATLSGNSGLVSSTFEDFRPPNMSRSTSALLSVKKSVARSPQATSDQASFIQADKELEQIQSLCETAAHQFLRDGDCKSELDTIRGKVDALLVQATRTAESLRNLQDHHEAVHVDSSASESNHDTESRGTLSTQPSLDLLPPPKTSVAKTLHPPAISHRLDGLKPQGFFSAPAVPTLGSPQEFVNDTIEVDDSSDQESIVVDLSQYRLTNPRRVRA
ncbi:hypothetical protein A1O7_08474 [Cladophialophora yegresii CBS 114405]|uniref:Uncharacterized protein n=1 Tax=Cladophialophora yegresii CBS 114405 TaxID=1182544 RepID=W9VTQ4_9EURO|nr:uncharacterized protein A1O7_08474 [Cladophialophora yegresii CBS 114405]EXJ55546.1 hypothetical protein A1O7_08474 [Cladophialophora yegresii CBS 114405]